MGTREQKKKKNITIFHLKINIFTAKKCCYILHWRVFVMVGGCEVFPEPSMVTYVLSTMNLFSGDN